MNPFEAPLWAWLPSPSCLSIRRALHSLRLTPVRRRLLLAREQTMPSFGPCEHGIERRAGFPVCSHLPGRHRPLSPLVAPSPCFSAEYLSAGLIIRDRKSDEIPARGCVSLERESIGEAPPITVWATSERRDWRLRAKAKRPTDGQFSLSKGTAPPILIGARGALAFTRSLPLSNPLKSTGTKVRTSPSYLLS